MFLRDNSYQRLSTGGVCGTVVDDPLDVQVVVHDRGKWSLLNAQQVSRIWGASSMTNRSFCRVLSENVFKLDSRHQKSLMRSLLVPTTLDVVGFYKGLGKKYAIVVRKPYDFKREKLVAGAAGAAAGAAVWATVGPGPFIDFVHEL
jgi:hypothetical protein